MIGREKKIIKDDSSLKALHAWFKQSEEKQKTLEEGGNRVSVHWKEAPSLDASQIEAIDYLAVIERNSNGKYRAYCPALKGVSVSANRKTKSSVSEANRKPKSSVNEVNRKPKSSVNEVNSFETVKAELQKKLERYLPK